MFVGLRVGGESSATEGDSGNAVGALGWLMAFWPVMTEPSSRPAEMWWVKLETMAGRTAVRDSLTPPMMARR